MDTVSDALTRIKNGYMASRPEVVLTYSKLIVAICQVLSKEGYIGKAEVIKIGKNEKFQQVKVDLKYENRQPALTEMKRVSKPGLRVYRGTKFLPWVLNGQGIALISTPKGIMTDKQARKEGLGGEILAYVW